MKAVQLCAFSTKQLIKIVHSKQQLINTGL